jgi:hypothetical protein
VVQALRHMRRDGAQADWADRIHGRMMA